MATEEDLLATSQARIVDDYDAYMDLDLLKQAQFELEQFLEETPKDLHDPFKMLDKLDIEVSDALPVIRTFVYTHRLRNYNYPRLSEGVS